ncbi:MAG: hypothetical protein FWD82_08675 [Defluviitaleaceae bacterium]|nr:hypothetical protein [Defluviitaleaceae bacterium]
MNTTNYKRRFIPLSQEHADYTLDSRLATGKCIIETVGGTNKISISVSNLKALVTYKPYLISSANSENIALGEIIVSERGTGELRFESSEQSFEDFDVVAIVFDNPEGLIIPLVGYDKEEVSWKNAFNLAQKPQISVDTVENSVENYEEAIIAEVIEEPIAEAVEEAIEVIMEPVAKIVEEIIETETSEPVEKIVEKIIEGPTLEVVEVIEIISEEAAFYENPEEDPKHQEFKETAREMAEKAYHNIDYKFVKNVSPQIEISESVKAEENREVQIASILKKNTKMQPFRPDKQDINWVRISTKELVYLPNDKWNYMNDNFVISQHKKYNHLVLGEAFETGELFLGLPDIYTKDHEVLAKNAGFSEFKCCEDVEIAEGLHGYWLTTAMTRTAGE